MSAGQLSLHWVGDAGMMHFAGACCWLAETCTEVFGDQLASSTDSKVPSEHMLEQQCCCVSSAPQQVQKVQTKSGGRVLVVPRPKHVPPPSRNLKVRSCAGLVLALLAVLLGLLVVPRRHHLAQNCSVPTTHACLPLRWPLYPLLSAHLLTDPSSAPCPQATRGGGVHKGGAAPKYGGGPGAARQGSNRVKVTIGNKLRWVTGSF